MTNHADRSIAHLDAARATFDHLAEEYGAPGSPGRRDPAVIGNLQQSIRFGLAAAKIEAQLATAANLAHAVELLMVVAANDRTSAALSRELKDERYGITPSALRA